MSKIFIDGSAGTTGLKIFDRLSVRPDMELLSIPENLRKDPEAKRDVFEQADIVFLCLPDEAARESALLANDSTAVIDTSTAHRTAEGWTYGFPELEGQRDLIKKSKRIANPGCHASGFISLVQPLVKAGILPADALLTCFSVTGYSGGGKKMIADYEADDRNALLDSPMQYGLTQNHKHLPEMTKVCGLTVPPVFCPIVSDFYSGMTVTVTVLKNQLNGTAADIKEVYRKLYTGRIVRYEDNDDNGIYGAARSGLDDMVINVRGNEDRILLISSFDNLGKGASGAAIQNMNLLLGLDETEGLVL